MYFSLTQISTPLGSRRHVWIPRILTTRLVTNSVYWQIVSIIVKLILDKITYYAILIILVSGIFQSFKHGAKKLTSDRNACTMIVTTDKTIRNVAAPNPTIT